MDVDEICFTNKTQMEWFVSYFSEIFTFKEVFASI